MTTQSPDNPSRVRRRRPPPRVVEVRSVTRITPRMVRITLGGEQLEGFDSKGPAEHIRIFLPDNETGEPLLPELGPEGNVFPDGMRPASRAYTPVDGDAAANELVVDIALHGHGPGAAWAANVKRGDVAVIGGQAGGAYFPDADADWYFIGGDEAALPAIGTLLDAMPSTMRAYIFAEVQDAAEEQELFLRCALRGHMASPR